jgi:isoleucyl-tRNA synthetase
MIGVGIDREAPYTDVLTHGWVLDAQGRAMHKSLGNVIAPEKLLARYGADVLRWWALATDWRNDVRVGDEILERVADAYRKVRNTFRFLLGNLDDFRPAEAVAAGELTAIDRVFDAYLSSRLARLRKDYEQFLFHRALDGILDLCTVDLSAVYLDVVKDRLYTLAADDPRRRSAQTVLWHALRDLAIAVSPALVTTAEEVWQSHEGLVAEAESVHLAVWADRHAPDEALADEWAFLRQVRDTVNLAIEPLRAAKELATTLEAEVALTAPIPIVERLGRYRDELVGFLMVARAELDEEAGRHDLAVEIRRTALPRCDRCWTHRPDVRPRDEGAMLCERCVAALAARGGVSPEAEARPGADTAV